MNKLVSGALIVAFLATAATAALAADKTIVTTVKRSSDGSVVYGGRVEKKGHYTTYKQIESEKTIPRKLDANIGGTGNTGSMSPIESPGQ
jgi:hypothetical protein